MLARRHRRLLALVACFVVAIAQTAAAAYACTRGAASTPMASKAIAPCESHATYQGTAPEGADNLCEVHCQATPVTSPGVVAMAPPPGDAIAISTPVPFLDGEVAQAPDARSTAPPARERYCRLQL